MLTARGWWFLIVVAFVLALGVTVVAPYTAVPALLAFTLLAWFAADWVLFQVRSNAAVSRLKLTRRVIQGDRDVPMVWSGLSVTVRVRVSHDAPVRVPFLVLEDRLPQAADLVGGDAAAVVDLAADEPARIDYTLKSPAPGILRFEGVRVRVADLHGFFYRRAFLRDETEYLILPPLTDDEGRQRADKRFNTLPPPGVHRLRRPGSGAELLDLRDYRPGDPPKMIAWKASARRDRLITKEYESDVPVRCVLFLDTSEGVRLGPPGGTTLARMASVASGVAQASAGNRDLVGLTTFDEFEFRAMSPARTKLHMINILRRLAEVAALQPSTEGVPPDALTHRAYSLAVELYPELMAKRINTMPLGRLWVPLLDRWLGWFVLAAILFPAVLTSLPFVAPRWVWRPVVELVAMAAIGLAKLYGERSKVFFLPATVFFFLFVAVMPAVLGALFWLIYGIRGWFGERRLQLTRRKQLAALFAVQDRTGPAGIERLIHDDEMYAARVGRFLAERQVRMPVPLYDDRGRYRYRCADKADVLAAALTRAVSRARDNEQYVILADLVELGPDLAPLLKAAKVARARHHQVMVIVPWPADVPPPVDKPAPQPKAPPAPAGPKKPKRKVPSLPGERTARLLPLVQDALTRQYHEAFRKMRRALGEVGATVVRVNEGDPVQLVLDRLDRLRGIRSRR